MSNWGWSNNNQNNPGFNQGFPNNQGFSNNQGFPNNQNNQNDPYGYNFLQNKLAERRTQILNLKNNSHNALGKIYDFQLSALNHLDETIKEDLGKNGRLTESTFNSMAYFQSTSCMIYKLNQDMRKFNNYEYGKKLISLSPKQLDDECKRVSWFIKTEPSLFDSVVKNPNKKAVEFLGNRILGDPYKMPQMLNDSFDLQHKVYDCDHNEIKNEFIKNGKNYVNGYLKFSNGRKSLEKIARSGADCYAKLQNMELFDSYGKITPDAMKQVTRLLAMTEIINNYAADMQIASHPFEKKLQSFNPKEFDAFVQALETSIETSPKMRNSLNGSSASLNQKNLLNIIRHPTTFSKELMNEENYKKIIKSFITPVQKVSPVNGFNNLEKQIRQDNLNKLHQKADEQLYQKQIEKGFYTLGSYGFDQTKDELGRVGSQITMSFLSGNMNLFKNMDDPKNPYGPQLKELYEGLENLSTNLVQYSKARNLQASQRDETHAKDLENLQSATQHAEKLTEICEQLMKYDISDSKEFQSLYATAIDIENRISQVSSGSLTLPGAKEEMENGKPIHRLAGENPDATELLKSVLGDKYKNSGATIKWEKSTEPPFSHDPCPSDIVQSKLGDCYFVSDLASVAAKNPQAIRDMMTYNEKDNTVTVRFYSMTNDPVYVTVENSLPTYEMNIDGKKVTGPLMSNAARWVGLIEKAYASSGIHYDEMEYKGNGKISNEFLKQTEQGILHPKMDVIRSGNTHIAIKTLLGPNALDASRNIGTVLESNYLKVPKAPGPIFPNSYSNTDLAFYNKMKTAYEEGKPLTCDIEIKKGTTDTDLHAGKGLPSGHAYAIVGFSEENGHKFVHVRNPHGLGIRTYDENRNPKEDMDRDGLGESKIELKDFTNQFDHVGTSSYNLGVARQDEAQYLEENKALYKETVNTLDYFIQKSSFEKKGAEFVGSPQYQELRKTSAALADAFSKDTCNSNDLKAKFKDYFNAANAFLSDENNKKELTSEMKTETYANKYLAANMISNLQALYYKNEKAENITKAKVSDYDELKADAMNSLSNDSLAKKTSVKFISEKEKAVAEAEKSSKEKLLKGLAKDEAKAIKNLTSVAKKGKIDTLANAIGELLYLESVKKDAENLSSKVLGNKLSKETKTNNILTSAYYAEEALENIEKMDPNALKEKIFDAKDPKELLENFKNLREKARQNELKIGGDKQPEQEKEYAKRAAEAKKAEEAAQKQDNGKKKDDKLDKNKSKGAGLSK